MKHGIMKLVYKEEILRTRQYWGIQHRKDIIEYWSKFYGVKFAKCFIHLMPEVNWNAVRKNGKNMRFKKDISAAPKLVTQKINKQIRYADKLRLTTSSHF